MSDCADCGHCFWQDCENDADYTIRGVTVMRRGSRLHVGDIDLCAGHYKWTQRTGHLNLDWTVIERALGNIDGTRRAG